MTRLARWSGRCVKQRDTATLPYDVITVIDFYLLREPREEISISSLAPVCKQEVRSSNLLRSTSGNIPYVESLPARNSRGPWSFARPSGSGPVLFEAGPFRCIWSYSTVLLSASSYALASEGAMSLSTRTTTFPLTYVYSASIGVFPSPCMYSTRALALLASSNTSTLPALSALTLLSVNSALLR